MRLQAIFVATTLVALGCTHRSSGGGGGAGSTAPAASSPQEVVLEFDAALPSTPRARIESLVRQASSSRSVQVLPAGASAAPLAPGSLVLVFGGTGTIAGLSSESFALRSSTQGGVTTLTVDGRGEGLLYGSYALLEELGFAFLHPLAPTIPQDLAAPSQPIDRTESPRWPVRGIHVHTMHPLELCEVANGWGEGDPNDAAGFQRMLGDWDRFLEWAVANRLNRVEWFLLAADSWRSFAEGPVRLAREKELVARAHEWGLAAGADMPIAEKQQHAWFMVEKPGTLADEKAQIDARVAWSAQAGFDFISTELGTSEFTSTDDQRMVAWLDELASACKAAGLRSSVKAHCSTGQIAKSYTDPITGGPLNYNFLARVCDPALGVYPHTVQMYGLDDPAPTYGNTDFAYVREFMEEEAGRREVVWHPETAYWVSYDVDVPLFLPVYGERRLHDLRLIAQDEDAGKVGRGAHAGTRIDGQMVFSSGWEWGYWLNDVLAARASWQPFEKEPTDEAALEKLLAPVLRVFGAAADDVRRALVECVARENALLVHGAVTGVAPPSLHQRTGIAYLEGWETWDDVAFQLQGSPLGKFEPTQPGKLGLVDMRFPLFHPGDADYSKDVEPLLAAMASDFATSASSFDSLRARVPATAKPLLDDMADAANMTALRARQVHGLYDYVATSDRGRLKDARDALDQAALVVRAREAQYRVDAGRIAGWRPNPTAYAYTYLWSVHSLHFWWRDEEKAVDAPMSPFVMNIVDPVDVAVGENAFIPILSAARAWGDQHGLGWLVDGLAEPSSEPVYPQGGLRQRP